MRIAVVYTLEESTTDRPRNEHGLTQLNKTTESISNALTSKGHEVFTVPANYELLPALIELSPDCIFNNCTGIHDKSSQPQIAGLLELSRIPFTGSSQLTHSLALYKPLAKRVFKESRVPTPDFQVFYDRNDKLRSDLLFPLIIKPEHEGSSIGISNESVVNDKTSCMERVNHTLLEYRQPALVEEFVSGREFTVGVLGNADPTVLPFVEIGFDVKGGFYSHQVKSHDKASTICPAKVAHKLAIKIKKAVLQAYRALGCSDYARIDARLNHSAEPQIIEVNTLPGLQEGYSDFPKAAAAAGIEYADLVERIVKMAIERRQLGL